MTSISLSSARDFKQGCSLWSHALNIMHRRKRTWMTKQKSRGAKTRQYPACWEHPTIQNHVETYQVFLNSCRRFLVEYLPHQCLKWMKSVTRFWLKIIVYVFIKYCTDPKRCSKNSNKHHLAWRKKILPSNKQKLIRFGTIEWVGIGVYTKACQTENSY